MTHQEFKELYARCRGRLVNRMTVVTRNRDTAEDVVSAALAIAFERLDTYRGEASFYTWLHAIAMNEARLLAGRCRTVSLDALSGSELSEPFEPDTLDQTLDRLTCCAKVRKALRRVPAVYRRTLVDRFMRGHSVERMSRRHRVPVGTVLSRLFTAKRLLRAAWEV